LGQKTNPIGLRLGINRTWKSIWFDEKNFANKLHEDRDIRRYIMARPNAAKSDIARIDIQRHPKTIVLTIHTAKPGLVIGQRGKEVDTLKGELSLRYKTSVSVNVHEIKKPDLEAQLVANNIAQQLVNKISFRRAMKKAIANTMRNGAQGVKITCSGRLGGAEMSRIETYKEGRIPLHTLRADIDYAVGLAKTTYGVIGVKVWIYRGEKFGIDYPFKK
jgi:small subunit ribosomal protein S3